MLLPDVAIGAIIAAIIAGTIAVAGLIGAKENKISEFRQDWVNALRSESAKLISHAIALDGLVGVVFKDRLSIWKNSREDAAGITEAAALIRMRLNPTEDQSRELLAEVVNLEKLLGFDDHDPSATLTPPAQGGVAKVTKRLELATAKVLRKDWKRIKRGEWKYLIALTLSVATLLAGVYGLGASTNLVSVPGNLHLEQDGSTPPLEKGREKVIITNTLVPVGK